MTSYKQFLTYYNRMVRKKQEGAAKNLHKSKKNYIKNIFEFFEKKACIFWKGMIVYLGTQVSACAGSSVG